MFDTGERRRRARLVAAYIASQVKYLLYDGFNTARTAGSVNGTPAEPTGQTRTVTDTNSKLSITGGVASFATGGSAEANPGLWYPSMTRVAGLMMIGQYIVISGTSVQGVSIGWTTATSNTNASSIRPILGTSLGIRGQGTAITVAADLGTSTVTYTFAVILSATGTWHFIKGGVYTIWTLLWINPTGNNTPMFPAVMAVGTTTVGSADNVRIPVNLYIPVPLAYDTFTRADGALGSTETTGPDSQVLSAIAWAFTAGVWTISTNKAIATPTPGSDVIVNGGFGADANWNKGAGWSIAAGVAAAVTASSDLTAAVAPLTVGTWYQVAYTISGFSAGTVGVVLGGVAFPTHATNNTDTETGRAGTTAFLLRGAGYSGSIDNVSCKPLVTAELFSSVLVSTADVLADVAITLVAAADGKQAGLVLNLDSTSNPQNFIIVYLDGNGNCIVDECVAGTYANKQTTAITYSAGAVLRAERSGTECRVFYNNAAVGASLTMTANTAKSHGLFSTSSVTTLDNYTCWARGTSNEYGTLDIY